MVKRKRRSGRLGFRRRKKRTFRRVVRRKRRRRRKLVLAGFPNKKLVRLKFSTTASLTPTAGDIPCSYFRANGCYDPDCLASAGNDHRPRGFNEWMQLYSHYTVLGSKIKVTPFSSFQAGIDVPNFGIVLRADQSFPYAKFSDLAESRLAGAGCKGSWRNLGTKTYTKGFSTRKFFGVRNFIAKALYRGTVSADPAEEAIFALWACTPDLRLIDPIKFVVNIEYIVMLTEPKYIGPSDPPTPP